MFCLHNTVIFTTSYTSSEIYIQSVQSSYAMIMRYGITFCFPLLSFLRGKNACIVFKTLLQGKISSKVIFASMEKT